MFAASAWALWGLGVLSPPLPIGTDPVQRPIIGGSPTDDGEFANVVAILAGTGLCTGTMVSDRVVLTAAHCLAHVENPNAIRVVFGQDLATEDTETVAVSFGTHPMFCEDCRNDIFDYGYIVIADAFQDPSGFIPPIIHQVEWDGLMKKGQEVRLVGYGEDPSASSVSGRVGTKRKVDTVIDRLSPLGFEFFAGGALKDSCEGDSGGPAFVRLPGGAWRLAGITSRGSSPCGQGGFYGVPYPALEWLQEETQVNLCGSCGSCDCLDVSPPDEGGCHVVPSAPPPATWASLMLLGLGGWLGRRRTSTSRS